MNTIYGMQQGLIHAYVSSWTFFAFLHSFCTVNDDNGDDNFMYPQISQIAQVS